MKCCERWPIASREACGRPTSSPATEADEFGLILPQADAQAAQRVTQRICTAIHLAQATVHGITLSAGTATLREGMTARDLVAEADRAMYLQRAEQRGQAVARPADR